MLGPGKKVTYDNIWHTLTKAVEEAGDDANKDVVGADAKTRWFNAARTGGRKVEAGANTYSHSSAMFGGLLWM